jgi:hypothetical protein
MVCRGHQVAYFPSTKETTPWRAPSSCRKPASESIFRDRERRVSLSGLQEERRRSSAKPCSVVKSRCCVAQVGLEHPSTAAFQYIAVPGHFGTKFPLQAYTRVVICKMSTDVRGHPQDTISKAQRTTMSCRRVTVHNISSMCWRTDTHFAT